MIRQRLVCTFARTTANAAGTEIEAAVSGLSAYNWFDIYATLTGLTGGALDVYLQRQIASGVWADWCHFPQLAAAAAARSYQLPHEGVPVITTIGIGTLAAPGVALAANNCLGGHPGDSIRAVWVSGVGTTAGAAQVIRVVGYNLGS